MKKHLTNIAIFLIGTIFILSFSIFGKDNILIGIGSITIAIAMINENHTSNMFIIFLKLALAQVIIGVASVKCGFTTLS